MQASFNVIVIAVGFSIYSFETCRAIDKSGIILNFYFICHITAISAYLKGWFRDKHLIKKCTSKIKLLVQHGGCTSFKVSIFCLLGFIGFAQLGNSVFGLAINSIIAIAFSH